MKLAIRRSVAWPYEERCVCVCVSLFVCVCRVLCLHRPKEPISDIRGELSGFICQGVTRLACRMDRAPLSWQQYAGTYRSAVKAFYGQISKAQELAVSYELMRTIYTERASPKNMLLSDAPFAEREQRKRLASKLVLLLLKCKAGSMEGVRRA